MLLYFAVKKFRYYISLMSATSIELITEEEVIRILSESEYYIPTFKNCRFENTNIFNTTKEDYTCLVFKNCIFENEFIITNRKIAQGVLFSRCTFEQGVTLKKLTCIDRNPFYLESRPNLYFNKCSITFTLLINGDFAGPVEIWNSTIDQLEIDCLSTKKSVEIGSCTISVVKICASALATMLYMYSNQITQLELSKLFVNKIEITGNEIDDFFNGGTEFRKESGGVITIKNNTITSLMYYISPYFNGLTFFMNNIIKKDSYLNSTSVNLNDMKFKRGINIEELWKKYSDARIRSLLYFIDNIIETSLDISSWNSFKKMQISINAASKGFINIHDTKIESLVLMGVNYSSTLAIDLRLTVNLQLKNLMNFSNIKLYNYYTQAVQREFKVHNSNLGKMEFLNVNFKEKIAIEITESNLSEIQYSSIDWFLEENLNGTGKDSSLLKFDSKNKLRYPGEIMIRYNLYKQLKNAAEKSKDKNLAVLFRSIENKYYFQLLKNESPFFSRERLLMSLNRSNEFGTNWTLPIKLIILVSLISYVLIIAVITFPALSFSAYLSNFFKYAFALPQLINPTHSLNSIIDHKLYPEVNFNFLCQTIDMLQRIAISYLIFQTIIAFRKQAN